MAALQNSRHERFAQELAKGCAASKAYERAGYGTSGNASEAAASRLLRNDKVQDRIAALQQSGAKRAEVTVESLIQEFEQAREMALSLKQPAAMSQATFYKARISGLVIDKKEDVTPRRTLDQIDARIRQLGRMATGSESGTVGTPGRAGTGSGGDEAIPTVPGHGSA